MIIFRKNPLSEDGIDLPFIEKESLKDALDRGLLACKYERTDRMREVFHIVVNGNIVAEDQWDILVISESDTVLIAPKLKSKSSRSIIRTYVPLAVGAVVSKFFGPVAGSIAAIGTSLLLNILMPPESPDLGIGGDVSSSSQEKSQMYSIAGQSNSAKRYGHVPKVYGFHRMFPLVAANPYTELEPDPDNNRIVQFFYCIYDFGFGPLSVTNLKIGDTSINDYADIEYRFVDINKPLVSEGSWDDVLNKDFEFYKGDIEKDGATATLDKNEVNGGSLEDYQVIRNASDKINGNDQEIVLDFICPEGLQGLATNGDSSTRTIELKIEFSKVGEDVWRNYNDLRYVYAYKTAGGTGQFSDVFATVAPYADTNYTLINTYSTTLSFPLPAQNQTQITEDFGYPVGSTYIDLVTDVYQAGSQVYFNGNLIGKIVSEGVSPLSGYTRYFLEVPTTISLVIWQRQTIKHPINPDIISIAGSTDLSNRIKIKKETGGIGIISNNDSSQVYAAFRFKPRDKVQYKVRITRIRSTSSGTYVVRDKLSLQSLSTRFNRNPILTKERHVFLEIKVRATNQLNGNLTNLSGEVQSILEVYDGANWVKQATSNPAWAFVDLLIGRINKKRITKDKLHLDSILEWAAFCDQVPTPPPSQTFVLPRFSCNFILDYETTLQGVINSVSGAAQASLNIIDGKYGVLLDKQKTVPLQIFTPRNSSNFKSQRVYSEPTHALRVRYVDPANSWDVSEVIVYADGYNAETATRFEDLSTFACTNFEQAWRYGRYNIVTSILRKEIISIDVDFEHLVCTRGDYVQITQDVMKVGGRPARVKSIAGTIITIDDAIETVPGSWGYTFRGVSGIQSGTLTIIDSDEFDLAGPMPSVGDLIIIGLIGNVVFDCLIKTISPSGDLTATLTLVEKADGIFLAESTDTFPTYDPQISNTSDQTLSAPGPVEDLIITSNTWRVVGSAYQYYIGIDWEVPIGSAYETFEIYVDSGKGYNLVDFTKESFYEYIVNPDNLNKLHSFKVLAVSANGKKINLIEAPFVTATPLRKITPPSDVIDLSINITNQVIQLEWPTISDLDLSEYLLRYSPRTTGATWEASIPLTRADKNTTSASVQGRKGSYFIKAIDLNGNESVNAATAITSIPNLFDLNVIETTNDFPALLGGKDQVVLDLNTLMIQKKTSGGIEINEYYPEGFYYYKDFLDLGDIYTVRLQSLIEAEGFTVGDLMSNWPDLSSLLAMTFAGRSDWDVESQYRATDSFNVMAEWLTLDSIDPISEGAQDNWTNWRKFIMTDATARIFQFRLRLISNKVDVTPRVYDGVIKSDMPDRVESYNNIVSNLVGVTTITYNPPFKGPGTSPNIQITQDSAQQGDYFAISGKTLDGFNIIFYDSTSTQVSRQFDVAVKGFGRLATAVI